MDFFWIFVGAFLEGNGLFWEVVVGKIDYYFFDNFADFCQFLAIFTFLVHFHLALWAFLAIFPIFLGFARISCPPAIYFADFGAIVAIFDHFWAIFGPFFGPIFFWPFLPKNGILAQV